MKTVVIADIHLKRKDDNKDAVVKFLKNIVVKYDKLIILGDFFEFWFGFKDIIIYDYFEILHEFKNLINKNIDIIYIEGNHDFCLGDFIEHLGVKIFSESYQFEINDKKFLAIHGDTINIENDKFYAKLRKFLRSNFAIFLMNNLPVSLILKIADKFSNASRKYLYKEHNLKNIIKSFKYKEEYDIVLSGHFHQNFSFENFYIIGDWKEQLNYLTIDDKGLINYQIFNP